MLEGKCLKCGIRYYGWALRDSRHQTCPNCGRKLQIKRSNGTLSAGYSPSLIDKHLLMQIMNIVDYGQKDKGRDEKDE